MKTKLTFFVIYFFISCNSVPLDMEIPNNFSWQGHRGARGLLPENTIPAFKKALDLGMPVLELDIAISADKQVVVSHEPWMSAEICLDKNGRELSEEEGKVLRLYEMNYSEIALYDCGTKTHPRFPEQEKMRVAKPLLSDMVKEVEAYAKEKKYSAPYYNIEIKSEPAYDTILSPRITEFVRLTIESITKLGIRERTNLQSFDLRALEEIHLQAPRIEIAYLVEDELDTAKALAKLTFTPDIYSPYYRLVNHRMLEITKNKGIKVIPWTVNETEEMKQLIGLGVDGIITDYPNRIPK